MSEQAKRLIVWAIIAFMWGVIAGMAYSNYVFRQLLNEPTMPIILQGLL